MSGIFNLVSDSGGHFCKPAGQPQHGKSHTEHNKNQNAHKSSFLRKNDWIDYKENFNEKGGHHQKCELNWISRYTFVNKIGNPQSVEIQQYLNLLTAVIIMIVLIFFRRSQRVLNAEIDISQQTPQDYSIIVRNIPKGLKINYEKELIQLFTHSSVPGHTIQVRKINLIYDIEEIEEIEHKIQEVVQKKKDILSSNGFDMHDPAFEETSKEIEAYENEIQEARNHIVSNPDLIAGICVVSFNTEQGIESNFLD